LKDEIMKYVRYVKEKTSEMINKERAVTYIVFMSLIAVITLGTTFAPKEITVHYGQSVAKVYSTSQTVGEVLVELGLEKTDKLFVVPDKDARVVSGMEIYIFNTEEISIYVDGRNKNIYMPFIDTGYLLSRQGIFLEEADRIESNIFAEESKYVRVIRVSTEEVEREVDINFSMVMRPNHDLFREETREVTQGAKGAKLQIVYITYEDEIPIKEQILSEEIIRQPIDQVTEFGTKERVQTAARQTVFTGNYNVVKEMFVEATAYTHTGNRTFTGIWPHEGVVAVDPRVIPLGTRMFIEGYGYATAADTGGVIRGNKIDVFMDTREQAINWGRRQVKIYILE